MPVQDYNINTRNAVVGQVYGLQGSAKVIDSWELVENVDANDTLAYGEPVLRTAAKACSNFVGVVSSQDVAGRSEEPSCPPLLGCCWGANLVLKPDLTVRS